MSLSISETDYTYICDWSSSCITIAPSPGPIFILKSAADPGLRGGGGGARTVGVAGVGVGGGTPPARARGYGGAL